MVLRLLWGSPFGNFFLTSKPYPVEEVEGLQTNGAAVSGRIYLALVSDGESLGSSAIALEGTLSDILRVHTQPPEDALQTDAIALDGTIQRILIIHSQPPEDALTTDAIAFDGTLRQILITHVQLPEDALQTVASAISGTLT